MHRHHRLALLAAGGAAALGATFLAPAAQAASDDAAVVIHAGDPGYGCESFLFGVAVPSTDKFVDVAAPDKSGNIQLTCHFADVGVYPDQAQHDSGFGCLVYTRTGALTFTNNSKAVLSTSGQETIHCWIKKPKS